MNYANVSCNVKNPCFGYVIFINKEFADLSFFIINLNDWTQLVIYQVYTILSSIMNVSRGF
jgi:hypothetical protein